MNLKLAKELKEAGYPQESGDGYDFYDKDGVRHDDKPMWVACHGSGYGIFTTDELLEALGERFTDLHRDSSGRWHASTVGNTMPYHRNYEGDSPTEALARLWIAVNQ